MALAGSAGGRLRGEPDLRRIEQQREEAAGNRFSGRDDRHPLEQWLVGVRAHAIAKDVDDRRTPRPLRGVAERSVDRQRMVERGVAPAEFRRHGLEGGLLDVVVFSDSVSDDSLEGVFLFEGLDSTIMGDDADGSFDSNGNWVYSDYNSGQTSLIKKMFIFKDSQISEFFGGDRPKVPEPATLSLVGLGALALLRKRK